MAEQPPIDPFEVLPADLRDRQPEANRLIDGPPFVETKGHLAIDAFEVATLHAAQAARWLDRGDYERAISAFRYADKFWIIAKTQMSSIRDERADAQRSVEAAVEFRAQRERRRK